MNNPLGFGVPRTSALEVWAEPCWMELCATPEGSRTGSRGAHTVLELGGPGIGTAVALAATGCPVRLWLPVPDADDPAVRALVAHGIEVHAVPGPPVPRHVVTVDVAGQSLGDTIMVSALERSGAAAVPMATGSVLHLAAGAVLDDTSGALRTMLDRARAPISLSVSAADLVTDDDVAAFTALGAALRPLLVFLDALAAELLAQQGAYGQHDARPEWAGCWIITDETRSTATDERGTVSVTAPASLVRDRTGGHDAFAGGVLAGLYAGLTLEAALELGLRLMSRTVEQLGTLVQGPVERLVGPETLW